MSCFHENLQFLLQKNGVSQAELAKTLNISPARLNQYMKGKAEASYDILSKLAIFFETSIDYLLGRTINHVCVRTQTDNLLFFNDNNDNSIIFTQNNDDFAPIICKGDIVRAIKDKNLGKPYVVVIKSGQFSIIKREKVDNDKIIQAEVVSIIKSFLAD